MKDSSRAVILPLAHLTILHNISTPLREEGGPGSFVKVKEPSSPYFRMRGYVQAYTVKGGDTCTVDFGNWVSWQETKQEPKKEGGN